VAVPEFATTASVIVMSASLGFPRSALVSANATRIVGGMRDRLRRRRLGVALTACLLIASGCSSSTTPTVHASRPTSISTPPVRAGGGGSQPSSASPCGVTGAIPKWRHVVWIVMENKSYGAIVGSPDAPYENGLAAQCGLAVAYDAVAHPSLPNYIAMTSGSTQDIADDDPPAAHMLTSANIFSQLGSDWQALEESMP
jgi:hypothetical protein